MVPKDSTIKWDRVRWHYYHSATTYISAVNELKIRLTAGRYIVSIYSIMGEACLMNIRLKYESQNIPL